MWNTATTIETNAQIRLIPNLSAVELQAWKQEVIKCHFFHLKKIPLYPSPISS